MIAGVLLAAGQSKRMGSPKQSLRIDGKSFLRRAAEAAVSSQLDEVVVVLGHAAEALRVELTGLPVRVVVNERYAEGQSTSLKAGLAAIDPAAEAVVVLLVDQPFVDAHVVDLLIRQFRAHRNPVIVPVWEGRRGNPVLFARSLLPELRAVEGDKGGRDVIQAHEDEIGHVPVDTPSIIADVDTPDEYERVVRGQDTARKTKQ